MIRIGHHPAWIELAAASVVVLVLGCGSSKTPNGAETKANLGEGLSSKPVVVNSIGMKLIRIAPGQFTMGEPAPPPIDIENPIKVGVPIGNSSEQPPVKVTISRAFYVGETEVTQAQFEKVMHRNPSDFSRGGWRGERARAQARGMKPEVLPVEAMTWYDALEFCNALSTLENREPCYELSAIERNEGEIRKATVRNLGGNGYRLPTEAEWEYACRAGTNSRWPHGDDPAGLKKSANVAEESYRRLEPDAPPGLGTWDDGFSLVAPVASFAPNPWGLFDMHGNVAEWCQDWYEDGFYRRLSTGNAVDPQAIGGEFLFPVIRGGSFSSDPSSARSASRYNGPPGDGSFGTGFRVVLVRE